MAKDINQLSVLLVEDDIISQMALRMMLENLGVAKTYQANSYASAVNVLDIESIDLVLVDIYIKGDEDGIELAKTINEKYKLPFIYISASSETHTYNKAVDTKPVAFLHKPYDYDTIERTIREAFEND